MTIHTIILKSGHTIKFLQGILNILIETLMLTRIRSFSNVLFFLSLILTLTLTSCGGGGGSDSFGTPYTSGGGGAGTNSVTVSWDAPTTNEDGTPLTDLAGYKTYYGSSPGNYTNTIDVGLNKTFVINNVTAGTWCFAVTAYDITGNESNYSDEICANL